MNKKKLLTGTITAVALSTLLVGGVTVFAANNTDAGASEEVYEEECCYEEEIDYGTLNEDEINRLNAIYDRLDAIVDEVYGEDEELTDEEFDARFAKFEEEYNNLDNEALDLEIKAGWYGDLNKDEVNRLYDIYDRMDAIIYEVYGEDEELTDEEFDARFAKYEAEYNQLDEEAIALETRAGFLEE